jgi:hypothetical protein
MRLVPGRVRQHPIQLARPALADGAARAKAQRCGCWLPLRSTAVVFGPTMMPCCPETVRRVSSRLVPSYKRARSTASCADASPRRWTATTSFDCAERLTSSSAAPRRAPPSRRKRHVRQRLGCAKGGALALSSRRAWARQPTKCRSRVGSGRRSACGVSRSASRRVLHTCWLAGKLGRLGLEHHELDRGAEEIGERRPAGPAVSGRAGRGRCAGG